MASPQMMKAIRLKVGKCDECGTVFQPEVLQSNAGFYVGCKCKCGPFSRESEYFSNREEAESQL